MISLTINNMTKWIRISCLPLVFILTMFSLGGCDETNTEFAPREEKQQDKQPEVSFELPEGWRWLDKANLEAIREQPAKGGFSPYVKLEFGSIEKGVGGMDREKVLATYNDLAAQCEFQGDDCQNPPELEQFKVGETGVSTAMYVSEYWGGPAWNSHIAFEKNGYIIELMLYDKATLYQNELNTIISTMSW